MKKLERDLDIVNLINLMKGYRIMRKVLFNHDQRLLLKFQKQDVINSDDVGKSEDESSNPDVDLLFDDHQGDTQDGRNNIKQYIRQKL